MRCMWNTHSRRDEGSGGGFVRLRPREANRVSAMEKALIIGSTVVTLRSRGACSAGTLWSASTLLLFTRHNSGSNPH